MAGKSLPYFNINAIRHPKHSDTQIVTKTALKPQQNWAQSNPWIKVKNRIVQVKFNFDMEYAKE